MKIIELEQGSEDWLLWRKAHITATSAGILMGHNPWRTPLDLYNEMLGFTAPQETNAAMTRGSEMEPTARALFVERVGIEMIPIVCESDVNHWMAASLDGWNEEGKIILEIKCPNAKTHDMALNCDLPIYYRDQIMHQFAVTQGKICYYMTYRPEHPKPFAIIEIMPDWNYIAEMIEVEREFYENHLCVFNPPTPKTLNMRSM